jgi:hypothetical protein
LQHQFEKEFIAFTPATDAAAQSLYDSDKAMAVKYLTDYSNSIAEKVFNTWKGFYSYLFMKYMDGNIKTKKEVPKGYKYVTPNLKQPGYSEQKYRHIATETGDKLKYKSGTH